MRQRLLVLFALLLGLASAPHSQTRTIGIDEIRPGMVGVGRTVFAGDTLEDFKVHILGVLRNVVAPKRDLILARLEGGPLAKTGVIAGMSGSPVYIDGRLLGDDEMLGSNLEVITILGVGLGTCQTSRG